LSVKIEATSLPQFSYGRNRALIKGFHCIVRLEIKADIFAAELVSFKTSFLKLTEFLLPDSTFRKQAD
jgi:hypothetical protein